MSIGERLRILRMEKHLTEIELEKKLYISAGKIQKYENDICVPTIKHLIDFSRFFIVTTDYLLGLSENRMNADEFDSQLDSYTGLSRMQKEFLVDFKDFLFKKYAV